jgi:tetratricopeptide (TPR) repeat protein
MAMRKSLVGVIIYLLIATGSAWGQGAMHFYDLGLKSTITPTKIKYFTEALELDPGLSAAYKKRGILYYFQEEYTEAIHDLHKVIELKPFESEAHLMLGLAYMKKGDVDEAVVNLNRAIELDPKLADAYSYRSELYRLKGMIEDAIEDATRAIELGGSEPTIGRAYTVRAKAYRELGRSEQAEADFKKALKLDPEYYMYSMLTSTELLSGWASESSSPKNIGWMGAAVIVALLFVVIFKLTISAPKKDDDN